MDWTLYSKFFIALVSIVDPISFVPLFLQFCGAWPLARQQRLINQTAAVTTLVLLIGFFVGEYVLMLFGISIASFRVAGGVLVMMLAFSMLRGDNSLQAFMADSSEDVQDALAVVPLSLPLLAGPGAISTVIIFAHKADTLLHYALSVLCILLLGALVWLILRSAPLVARSLGPRGLLISNKVMALVLTAIGIEFIASGVRELFPVLAG